MLNTHTTEADELTFGVRTGQVVIIMSHKGHETQAGGKMYFLKGLNAAERESLTAEKDRDARWSEYSDYVYDPNEDEDLPMNYEYYARIYRV